MGTPDIFYKEAGGNQSTFDIFLFWNPPYFASNPHFAFDHVEWLKRSNMSPNTPKQERFWVTEIIIRTSLKIYIKLTKGRSHNKSQAEAKPSYIWSICPNSNSDPPPPPLLMASGHSFCSCGDRGGQSPFSQSEPVFSKCHRQMVPLCLCAIQTQYMRVAFQVLFVLWQTVSVAGFQCSCFWVDISSINFHGFLLLS